LWRLDSLDAVPDAELVDLLRSAGIIRNTPEEPLVDRTGRVVSWGLYTSNVTWTHRGMELAGRALLDRLATFRATQLAAYGHTAMPLLAACVLLGEGRYSGLSIREQPKAYLTRRRIDGPRDRGRPVVVIDDSISSGTSLYRSIEALEADGFEVEGAVALVRFPFRDGAEWGYRNGYRVEALFDIWDDLKMARPSVPRNAGLLPDAGAGAAVAPPIEPGLPPAVAARQIAARYLATGTVPGPPPRLDAEYDGRGGVFVSFRHRDTEDRVARDGFWHFDAADANPCRDLVAATIRTIDGSDGAVSSGTLAGLKIAVSFFGPLEKVRPADLDYARYGIVVRDTTFRRKLGGALPNTQVFVSEIEQYTHAWKRNAGLVWTEPHDLFRHEITKHVEPGESWLPYGCPDGPELSWADDDAIGRVLTDRVRAVLTATPEVPPAGVPVPPGLVPYPLCGVAVGLYHRGLLGCGLAGAIGGAGPLDDLLRAATQRAMGEVSGAEIDGDEVAVVVTLLHDREQVGTSPKAAAAKIRRGLDAVTVADGRRRATALPGVIPYNNMTRYQMVSALAGPVLSDAGGAGWSTCRTTSWVNAEHGLYKLRFGFPRRRPVENEAADDDELVLHRRTIELLAGYIVAGIGPDGLPTYLLDPVRGIEHRQGTSVRLVAGLVALDKAGRLLARPEWIEAARPGLLACLEHVGAGKTQGALALPVQQNSVIADCVLLEGVTAAGPPLAQHPAMEALTDRVFSMFRADGRICRRPVCLDHAQDHDFLPGVALMAAAVVAAHGGRRLPADILEAARRWHRTRFRLLRTWGMAGWQPQGWAAICRLTGDADQASYVFEVADWALDRQLATSGAFLEDLSPTEPSFNTGFVAEGVAAAWGLARDRGEFARQERYRQSWRQAMRFVDTLIVHPQDTFCFASAERAVGGVRMSLTRSDLRIDAASHVLTALVGGVALLSG
jgi:orotate phosphoribosyltransferase/AMMECR1 domain-containing protein